MKHLPILLIASLLLPVALHSQDLPPSPQLANPPAPSDDQAWDRLSFVPGNQEVFITSKHEKARCESLSITDEKLSCEAYAVFNSSRTIRIPRSEVLRVRERLGDGNSGIVVVTAVAGGYVWGHSWDQRALHTFDGIIVGTAFGFATWKVTPIILHFLPGKTIYRRPAKAPEPHQGDTPETVSTPAQSMFVTP